MLPIRIMLSNDDVFQNQNLDYARDLLKYFVCKAAQLYGPTYVTYNVHSLSERTLI